MTRRGLSGFVLIPLLLCGSVATRAQAPNAVSTPPEQRTDAQPPPSAGPSRPRAIHDAKGSKKVQASPDLRSLPLSAAAHASEPYDSTPISPAQKTAPATHSWTGFYVGAGAGVGTTQP